MCFGIAFFLLCFAKWKQTCFTTVVFPDSPAPSIWWKKKKNFNFQRKRKMSTIPNKRILNSSGCAGWEAPQPITPKNYYLTLDGQNNTTGDGVMDEWIWFPEKTMFNTKRFGWSLTFLWKFEKQSANCKKKFPCIKWVLYVKYISFCGCQLLLHVWKRTSNFVFLFCQHFSKSKHDDLLTNTKR